MVDTHWVALSLLPKVGTKTITALIETFGTAEAALAADAKALTAIKGIGKKTTEAILNIDVHAIESQMKLWQAQGVSILSSTSADYPSALSSLADAPPTLFMRGTIPQDLKAVAIVGTRNPSSEARQIAFNLGKMLAGEGWTIISGLALGIDTAAHEGALTVADGRTLAVLGSGVLNIYPENNQTLAQRILQRGAIIGENHPYAAPKPARLVSRNRIITGLSQHVIVVESSVDGGAMYAARFAREQGRTLHTVMSHASGNLELLKNGAHAIHPMLENFSLDMV